MNYGKRHKVRKVMNSPITVILLVVVIIVLLRATWNIYGKVDLSRTKLNEAQSTLVKLQQRGDDLQAQVNRLSTEQGVEAEIRTKYKGIRAGESVAVIVGDDSVASATEASTTQSVGWFKGLLQKIGL